MSLRKRLQLVICFAAMLMNWRKVFTPGLIRLVLIHRALKFLLSTSKIELSKHFLQMEQVAPTLVPLLKFYFHEEVRKAAVSGGICHLCRKNSFCLFWLLNILRLLWMAMSLFSAMPDLLRSAKLAVEKGLAQGRNETYVKQLSDYIIPALVEAVHKVFFNCRLHRFF